MKLVRLSTIFFVGTALSVAHAAALGDSPTPLKSGVWVTGAPVDVTSSDGIYVVEVWATWCPPCRQSIPHLTELQRKYKDKGVVIIGVTDEDPEPVQQFVLKMGDKMRYHVLRDQGGALIRAYMSAFGVSTIPYAFVVQRGRIIWRGSPLRGLDLALEQIVNGTYDAEAAIRKDKVRELVPRYFEMVRNSEGTKEVLAQARKLGEQVVRDAPKSVRLLDNFAWGILMTPKLVQRDLDLAQRVIEQANKAAGERDASVLDTYARVLSTRGEPGRAVELQEKAIALSRNTQQIADYKQRLEEYRVAARATP
jgi:thiol-disulfide isomerase/thioredoxin